MGRGHQPSIPISEAQVIGEADGTWTPAFQLDLPRMHASQMSTSRVSSIINQVSVAPMWLTEHFHDFKVYILCWPCMRLLLTELDMLNTFYI